ncbi:MAG TPA: metal ABC transporter substrate-binding protein [Micromonosporaceae bacterium]|jgi:zinc transport system substrate-binding protein|nr:metal ABC transporter substrate-binding protein [Micromonosporaceae bacterium]
MARRASKVSLCAALGAALVVGTAACSAAHGTAGRTGTGQLRVVAGFYPLQVLAERIGGDAVSVTNLAKPGAEPHDLELNPGQVASIADAALVVYLKGFQPDVDKTVAQEAAKTAFDVTTVEPLASAATGDEDPAEAKALRGKDPHVWLDPTRLATIGDRLADRLSQLDPGHTADFRSRTAALRTDLEKLDKEYAEGLRSCARRDVVTSHAAFGYLAKRYGLTQVAITGISPEQEPSPQRLAEVAAQAKAHQATTIFFETLVSPKVAQALANEVGARTAVLDPIEGLQPGSTADYLSVMRANLATLRPALGCP